MCTSLALSLPVSPSPHLFLPHFSCSSLSPKSSFLFLPCTCCHRPPTPHCKIFTTSQFSRSVQTDQYLSGLIVNSSGSLILLHSGVCSWSISWGREQSHLVRQLPRAPRFKPQLHHLQPMSLGKLTESFTLKFSPCKMG